MVKTALLVQLGGLLWSGRVKQKVTGGVQTHGRYNGLFLHLQNVPYGFPYGGKGSPQHATVSLTNRHPATSGSCTATRSPGTLICAMLRALVLELAQARSGARPFAQYPPSMHAPSVLLVRLQPTLFFICVGVLPIGACGIH